MINFKYAFSLVSILILCFFSTVAFAERSSEIANVPKLEDYPGFLKYEDPTKKGIAHAKILLVNGDHIVMELFSPAYNIHGVNTAPDARTEREKEQVAKATKEFLESPQEYISFLPKFSCSMEDFTHKSKPRPDHRQAQGGATDSYVNYVQVEYIFSCLEADPEAIIIEFFSPFPLIKEIQAQLIENNSKLRRINLSPDRTMIEFTPSSSN